MFICLPTFTEYRTKRIGYQNKSMFDDLPNDMEENLTKLANYASYLVAFHLLQLKYV